MASSTSTVPSTCATNKNPTADTPAASNNTTPSSAVTATRTPPSSPPATTAARRSARVHKRDPIVAPGFGTERDLRHLSDSLGLPYPAVRAMMDSRGRGMTTRRGQKKTEETTAAAATTPVSSAWADFMQEEGVDVTSSDATATAIATATGASRADSTTTAATSASAAAAAISASANDNQAPRDYDLPLVPRWLAASTTASSTASTSSGSKSSRPTKKAKTAVASKKRATSSSTTAAGLLVQAGTLDANAVGRSKRALDRPYDLVLPTVLTNKIKFIRLIGSCSAAHMMAIDDTHGAVYGWGRNDQSQLGGGGATSGGGGGTLVATPTRLEVPLPDAAVVDGAVGKSHSVLLFETANNNNKNDAAYAIGSNKCGQLGINNKTERIEKWRKCVGIPASDSVLQVACGEQFTVVLTTQGDLYTTGSSEFGQLGNGDTGEYFVTANKLAFANCHVLTKRTVFCVQEDSGVSTKSDATKVSFLPQPLKLAQVACGKNHAIALEAPSSSSGTIPRVVTWGCGNYGCLGHNVQADSYHPQVVTALQHGRLFQSNPVVQVAAGAHCSLARTRQGHVYYCGKHRSVGEATMRPALLDVLANNGHVVTHVAAGSQTVVCSTANAATVAWGQGPHGELGYGADRKSSSKPQFVASLEKCQVLDLACTLGSTLYLVKDGKKEGGGGESDDKAVKQLPVLKPKDTEGLLEEE